MKFARVLFSVATPAVTNSLKPAGLTRDRRVSQKEYDADLLEGTPSAKRRYPGSRWAAAAENGLVRPSEAYAI
jgi:hypothetical protein